MKHILPLGKRVLLKKTKKEEMRNGLIIPDSLTERQSHGEVIAMGPDVETLDVGDKVMFYTYAGTAVSGDDENLLLINVEDILCVIVEE